ncbi:flavin reductase family protein [Streptomyces sp. NPDC056210]|uniref:flavin reductase family protein n=1 Tax=Streptomyces sp. NPDC056210 TaxID=3345746 RepID=UPI0035D90532
MTDVDPFNLPDHPMYVVTADADGERAGSLVGYASQCWIQPARFMVWPSRANRTYQIAHRAQRLAVHLLRRDQDRLARLFGGETGDRTDKFTARGADRILGVDTRRHAAASPVAGATKRQESDRRRQGAR